MTPDPSPPRCGHVGSLSFTHVTNGGATEATRPIPCWADATHLIDGQSYRCADHLGAFLVGDAGSNWEVVRLDAPLGADVEAALTAAGAPCTLDRLQWLHATTAERVGLIAGQRDQLKAALVWLDEDPDRLLQVLSEISRRRERARAGHEQGRTWIGSHLSSDAYAEMNTPTVGQAIAELAGPALHAPAGS